jgi:hypothetical protein
MCILDDDDKKKKMELMDRLQEEGKQYYDDEYLIEAHKHSSSNESEILASSICVCFYCGYKFNPEGTKEELSFIEEADGKERTLQCPMCSIDSVIGDASKYPVQDPYFIARFTRFYWNGYSRIDSGDNVKG